MSNADPRRPRSFAIELPDGGVLRGDELAGDAPAYLYVHGLGSVRAGMKSDSLLEHALARGRAFVRFDQRGHGESSGTIGHVTIRELVADLLVVLERLQSCVLIGSSLGGLVAAFASVAAPHRVRGLCLIAPALGLAANLGQRLDADGCMQTSNGLRFRVAPRVLADAATLDESGLASRITVPTAIVHGTHDDVVSAHASERFFASLPHRAKDLWLVAGGDHRLADRGPETWRRIDAVVDRAAE